ncbi:MAG: hypothetical protein KAX49_16800 [Halanaerobiales bacterium]|nr:hypothetical protein [Halanaerobiales bacterium]
MRIVEVYDKHKKNLPFITFSKEVTEQNKIGKYVYYKVQLDTLLKPEDEGEISVLFEARSVFSEGLINLNDSFYGNIGAYPRLILMSEYQNELFMEWDNYYHSDYEVKITLPINYKEITSGFLKESILEGDKKTSIYFVKGIPTFGIILGSNLDYYTSKTKNILIKSWYRKDEVFKNEKFRAKELLDIAKESIDFYYSYFDFYPQKILNIVSGRKSLLGGYASSNILFIHDFNKLTDKLEWFSKYIIAHEIAHMYFGMYLNDDNTYPKWLTIGLSMWADKKFTDYLNIKSGNSLERYYKAALEGRNLIIMQRVKKLENEKWDWNGALAHDTAFILFRDLENLVGESLFLQIVRELFKNYHQKIIKAEDFFEVCNQYDETLGKFLYEKIYQS